ncbi:MAG TPA: LysR substrate-binding domain-containing protein [Burkholderiales bacterium]|nr:LysR substrate-binding domain-containing protein [Burkholderiales bacterium]
MDLRKLRYFIAVAEEASFRRAAERLHVTQPTLSEQVQELEKDIGVALFERMPRGVRLSRAGESLLREARRLLGELDEAVEQARRVGRGETARLRVAFSEVSAQQRLVAEALHRFRRAHGEVALELTLLNSAEQRQALREGEIDAGFLHESGGREKNIATEVLQTDHYVLVIARDDPLARKKAISAADLEGRTLLWAHRKVDASGGGGSTESHFASIGIPSSRLIRTGGDTAAISLASVGMGVGLVLSSQRLGDAKTVVYRELPGKPRLMNAVLAWRRDNGSVALRNLVELVRGMVPPRGKT